MTELQGVLLEKLRKEFNTELGEYVISDLIDKGDYWKSYLFDVSKYGCVSGAVSSLIYYNDTITFHDRFENEIDELINECINQSELSFSEIASSIDVWDITQLKNWKSWFAYETVVNNIIMYLEELEQF